MLHKRIIPIVVLLAWMPLLSAHAEGEKPVNFKTTLKTISRLYRQLDYEQALDQIQLARQHPLGTSDLVLLSLYEGIVLYDMGKQVESGDAFQMALLMDQDAKLPEQVAPKIENHFETFRRKIQQEMGSAAETRSDSGTSGASPKPSIPGSIPSDCPRSRIAAKGRTLKAQQLWRLASIEQLLCVRGIRGGEVAGTLSALKAQVTAAGTGTEWMRLSLEIDQLSNKYGVYPSNEDWQLAKSSVPEELWELGDEDQDVPLPEAPAAPVAKSPSEEEPNNLFGCRAAVAFECERLMRQLLLLQNQTPYMDAASKNLARKELFLLAQRAREASSTKTLEEVSRDIEAWLGKWLKRQA